MSIIGNILWIIFGIQLMKLGALALAPFGKTVDFKDNAGCTSIAFSVLWILFGCESMLKIML